MENVLIAVIGIAGIIGSPALLAYLTGRQRRADKLEDWKRQDAVAAKVDEAAVKAAEAASLLLIANERVAKTAKQTDAKIDDVHKIVNQQRTDAQKYQADLIAALVAAGVAIPPDASLEPSKET